jgi:hypothetical protein
MFKSRKQKEMEAFFNKVKLCVECGTVQNKDNFDYIMPPEGGYFCYLPRKKHCKNCEPLVEKREEAVELAKANPDKVIKCAGKKP